MCSNMYNNTSVWIIIRSIHSLGLWVRIAIKAALQWLDSKWLFLPGLYTPTGWNGNPFRFPQSYVPVKPIPPLPFSTFPFCCQVYTHRREVQQSSMDMTYGATWTRSDTVSASVPSTMSSLTDSLSWSTSSSSQESRWNFVQLKFVISGFGLNDGCFLGR